MVELWGGIGITPVFMEEQGLQVGNQNMMTYIQFYEIKF